MDTPKYGMYDGKELKMVGGPDMVNDVAVFCLTAGHDIAVVPHIPPKEKRDLRNTLNKGEWRELWSYADHPYMRLIDETQMRNQFQSNEAFETWKVDILTGIADGIGDLIYVLIGMAFQYGIPISEIWNRIQKSNMDKFPGGIVTRRADGKVLKPIGWQPPDIRGAILEAMQAAQSPTTPSPTTTTT